MGLPLFGFTLFRAKRSLDSRIERFLIQNRIYYSSSESSWASVVFFSRRGLTEIEVAAAFWT